MDYQEAERRFRELENGFRAGKYDLKTYEYSLSQIRVVDGTGRIWQMQAHTGIWFYYLNGRWVKASPFPTKPSAVNPQAPRISQTPSSQKRRSPLVYVVGGLLVVFILCGLTGRRDPAGINNLCKPPG